MAVNAVRRQTYLQNARLQWNLCQLTNMADRSTRMYKCISLLACGIQQQTDTRGGTFEKKPSWATRRICVIDGKTRRQNTEQYTASEQNKYDVKTQNNTRRQNKTNTTSKHRTIHGVRSETYGVKTKNTQRQNKKYTASKHKNTIRKSGTK